MWFSSSLKKGDGTRWNITLVVCEKCGRAQLAVVDTDILPKIEGVCCDMCQTEITALPSWQDEKGVADDAVDRA